MKTTIEIADPLLARAKAAAARRGTTLRALVEAGLRRVLAEREGRKPFKLRNVTFRGRTPAELFDPARLREAAYDEGRGGAGGLDD